MLSVDLGLGDTGAYGQEVEVTAVRGLLHHEQPEIRQQAVRLLGRAGDASVKPEVEKLLKDASLAVRTEALLYLTAYDQTDPLARIEQLGEFEDFLRHIDHVVDMVGVDHVGFGTDLTEEINPTEMMTETGELGNWPNKPYRPVVYPPLPWIFPPEIDSLSKMGNITLGLLARGYSDEDARKIMGGNFLRVFSEVWK